MLHNQHSSVNSQLDRLERISNQISLLISNNDYERISHLDRMRKKNNYRYARKKLRAVN